MLKFDASIFGGELPVGLGVVGIAVVLPGGDFVEEDLFVGNNRCAALFVSTVSPDSETRIGAAVWAPDVGRPRETLTPTPTWIGPPSHSHGAAASGAPARPGWNGVVANPGAEGECF
jgi:hypothetical protein